MKIIKHGVQVKVRKTTRFKCSSCGCVFEMDDKEFSERGHYFGSFRSCECPECGEHASEVIMR